MEGGSAVGRGVTSEWIWGAVLLGGLAWLSVVDWRTLRLPDRLTFPLLALGMGWSLSVDEGVSGLLGAALGYSGFVALEVLYRRVRGRHGLGRGDAKLAAVAGAWCGAAGLPFVVMSASGAGLLAALLLRERLLRDGGRMPFGPFLAWGTAVVWVAQRLV